MDLFIDLAENPGKYPIELVGLVNQMENDFVNGELGYKELAEYVEKFEVIGYSFEFGLDSEPYNLKKL